MLKNCHVFVIFVRSFGSSTKILAKFWKSNYDRDLKIIISTCWNKDYLWHERIYDRYSSLPLASFEILCIYKTLVHKCHLILIKNIQSFPVTVFHRRSPMERQEELQRKLTFHLTNHYIQHHQKNDESCSIAVQFRHWLYKCSGFEASVFPVVGTRLRWSCKQQNGASIQRWHRDAESAEAERKTDACSATTTVVF